MFGGFGGILPLRLGGASRVGWTAAQHARTAADMASALRTAPLASLTVNAAFGSPTVVSYHGRNGSGLGNAPQVTCPTQGTLRVTWSASYASEFFRNGLAVPYGWAIRSAKASGHWDGAPVIATLRELGPNVLLGPTTVQIDIRRWNGSAWVLADGVVSLRVYGDWQPEARIGDYDGASDKIDCETEQEPYAWLWYQEYTAMLGSAFTNAQRGLVHAKKLTLARFEAGKTRAAERARANTVPVTADDCLEQWVEVLKVPVRASDQRWQIRQRCAAKMRMALGATKENIDASLLELFGAQLIRTEQAIGVDLDTPPPLTYWPGINPGPAAMDLGGGAWSSERAHLTVLVNKPAPTQLGDFLYQMNVTLFQHLDRALPAKSTFNWTTSIQGFLLDGAAHADGTISQLDFDGLTPS